MIANAVIPLLPAILQYEAVGPYMDFIPIAFIILLRNLIALFLLVIGSETSALIIMCLCSSTFVIHLFTKNPAKPTLLRH